MNQTTKQVINDYYLWITPLLLGLSHYLFPYDLFPSELAAWLIKGICFLAIPLIVCGKHFYAQHYFHCMGVKLNSLPLLLLLYFFIGTILFTSSEIILQGLSTSMIFIPLLEEFTARSFLVTFSQKGTRVITIIVLSSITFSLSHWFTYESLMGIETLPEHLMKFLAHFNFGLMAAIITYAYKRIDLPILLHALGNFSWILMLLNKR